MATKEKLETVARVVENSAEYHHGASDRLQPTIYFWESL